MPEVEELIEQLEQLQSTILKHILDFDQREREARRALCHAYMDALKDAGDGLRGILQHLREKGKE